KTIARRGYLFASPVSQPGAGRSIKADPEGYSPSAAAREATTRPDRRAAEERVARRLTTILSADVVGYSRLMALDEEATIRVLDRRLAVLTALLPHHTGRLFKTMGDGALAEFDSPVEAVRCAIEFQEAMRTENEGLPEERRMRFRVGINLGDVVSRD